MNLKELLAKKIEDLSVEEKAFIAANAEKLSDEEKAKFADILDGDDSLDAKALEEMLSKSAETILTKKVDEMATQLVEKFTAGVGAMRKRALDTEVKKDAKADDKTRTFIKALMNGDRPALAEMAKAVTTGTGDGEPDNSAAGYTIPTELQAEVLRIAEKQFGLARRDMRYLPFGGPGNSRTIPVLGSTVSVYWTEEKGKKKGTQPGFGLVTQTLKKLAAIVPFTEEILEDSAINLTALVAELFAEAIAKEEDLQFFAGTGSPWTGLLNNTSVPSINSTGDATQFTADDLLDLIDQVPTGALAGAKFYMSRTARSVTRKLKGSDGHYILQNPGAGLPPTIWDYPVEVSDAFPAVADVSTGEAFIIFGNLKLAAVFGDKQQMRVKLLEEATITDSDDEEVLNLAEQDMVALRIVERVGYVAALPTAIARLKASATES